MTTAQFKTEFERLLAAFPYFKPPNAKAVANLWLEKLKNCEARDFHQAADEVIDEAPEFFPVVGTIARRCIDLEKERRQKQMQDALRKCQVCAGIGWKAIEKDGIQRVMRCDCVARMIPQKMESGNDVDQG